MNTFCVKNNKARMVIVCFLLLFLSAVGYLCWKSSNFLQRGQLDTFNDLEITKLDRPSQERDLEKYPLASMYYQDMSKRALLALHHLKINCDKVAAKIPNVQCHIPDLKSFERTIEKINNDYHGDFKKVLDLIRGSIVADNLVTLRLAIKEFNNYYKIAQTKNRFRQPLESGYRDFLEIFYDEEANLYGEMQFHLRSIFVFKEEAHALYQKIRSIEGKAKLEQRELSKHEKEEIAVLLQKSKEGYERAFFASIKGKK